MIGSGTRRFVRAIGSGTWRFLRAIGSGTCKFARAIWTATRRSPSAIGPVPTPIRPSTIAHGRWTWALATPMRRLLIALLAVLAFAGLLVALFPEVRADFGFGDDEKLDVDKPTKRRHTPAPVPARDRPRDKER